MKAARDAASEEAIDDLDLDDVISELNLVMVQAIDPVALEARQSNGTTIPLRKAPKKRGKKEGPAADIAGNAVARAAMILHTSGSYLTFQDLQPIIDPALGGRPRIFPLALYSLMHSLHNAITTNVSIVTYVNLSLHLPVVRDMIESLLPQFTPDEADIARRWLAHPQVPSDTQFGRFMKSLPLRGFDHVTEVVRRGVRAAIEDGRFSRTSNPYLLTNQIIGDGTVLEAASKGEHELTADPQTGEITQRRVDTLALQHREGGGKVVHGTKFAFLWSKREERHGTLPLAFAYVGNPSPAVEADIAVALARLVQEELHKHEACAAGFIYDRAADGQHQAALNEFGMVLTTRAMADQPEQADSHFRKPKYIGHHTPECGSTAHFVAIQKHMHLRVLDVDGNEQNIPLKHTPHTQRYKLKVYHYTDFTYDCPCGTSHVARFSWNGWKSAKKATKQLITIEDERSYRLALRYLQPLAPDSYDFDALYPHRNISESKNSEVDALLPFKRLQRWGLAAKMALLSGYLIGMIHAFTAMREDELVRRLRLRR